MLNLDVKVFWLSKCTYLPANGAEIHSHPFFHYLYIIDGAAQVTVGEKVFSASEEEFYLISPGVKHGFVADQMKGLKTIEIKFTACGELGEQLTGLGEQMRLSDGKVRHLAENVISEGMNKAVYWNDIVNLRFSEILMHLLRAAEQNAPVRDAHDLIPEYVREIHGANKSGLEQTLIHMEKNLERPLSLDTLAKVGGMGRFQYNRAFKSAYGVTPIQYLGDLRFAKAKELMRYSDKNVTQIAYSVGFNDVHYFSRFFKQREKVSPNEYLKKARGSLYIYLDEKEK